MTTTTQTPSEFLLARIGAWEDFWNTASSEEINGRRLVQVMLADCEAKRRIVALHHPSNDHGERFDPYCVGCWEAGGEDGAPSYPCPTLRLLALPFADHPDYNPDWRP